MKCPFCPQELTTKADVEEHIKNSPPQFTEIYSVMEELMKASEPMQLQLTAASLTGVVCQTGKRSEEVVRIFNDILRLLMGSPV